MNNYFPSSFHLIVKTTFNAYLTNSSWFKIGIYPFNSHSVCSWTCWFLKSVLRQWAQIAPHTCNTILLEYTAQHEDITVVLYRTEITPVRSVLNYQLTRKKDGGIEGAQPGRAGGGSVFHPATQGVPTCGRCFTG